MLVISRKASQVGGVGSTFTIGDAIVQVIEIRGGKVRLGIVADPNVSIVRDDVTIKEPRLQGCNHEPSPK
jgi:carbon storage regulator CsrA